MRFICARSLIYLIFLNNTIGATTPNISDNYRARQALFIYRQDNS